MKKTSLKKQPKNLAIVVAENRCHLETLMRDAIKDFGHKCNLNFIDVSNITDMSSLFTKFYEFDGDISKWDVSNVTNMSGMFERTMFNGNISAWDVSNVTDMSSMFEESFLMAILVCGMCQM